MKNHSRSLRCPVCRLRFGCWLGVLILMAPSSSRAEWGVNFQTTYVKSSLVTGTYPYALVSGDFTGDGRNDLAVANAGADPASGLKAQGYVSILANGGGTFTAINDIPTGSNTVGLAAGDFNRDGAVDLAATNSGSNSVSLLLNRGGGLLHNDQEKDLTTGRNPAGIVCADFNEDGTPDLVVANSGSDSISIFLGIGDGSFNGRRDFATAGSPLVIAASDFNRDGHLDVAVTAIADEMVSILLGHGDGTFGPGSDVRVDTDPIWIAAADLNGDEKPDLVVSCEKAVDVLIGMGDGAFERAPNATGIADTRLQGVAVVDLDQDGKLDLIVAHQGGGFAYLLAGRGDGVFSSVRSRSTLSSGSQPVSMVSGLFDPDPRSDFAVAIPNLNQVAICRNATTWAASTVPVVVSAEGAEGSFFTSELTITNPTDQAIEFRFNYRSSTGGGEGTGSNMIGPREQKIVPDAIEFLRTALGVPIPGSGNRLGTVAVRFTSRGTVALGKPASARVTVRTTTRTPSGRAGLAYSDVSGSVPLVGELVFLCGLRQNGRDRSNLALLHAGPSTDPDVTLRLTVYSGDPANPVKQALPDVTLKAGEFRQINNVLASGGLNVGQGFVKVERVGSGAAPYYAYAVINDQVTSDGSFISPNYYKSQFAVRRFTLPVAAEAGGFRTEVILTNATTIPRDVSLTFVADAIQSPDHSATLFLQLQPAEQRLIPDFVQFLRSRGIAGVGPAGGAFAGSVFATLPATDPALGGGFFMSGRTSIAGDGGYYGLHYPAVPEGQTARTSAWLYGLQQNDENRTNLALINTGENGDSDDVFNVEIYDGALATRVGTLVGIVVKAQQWIQLNAVLREVPGTSQGFARVVRTSGTNPFIAYAVVNDGAAGGQRSGDGAYVAMQGAE